jgi:hypothetical protein
LKKKSQKVWWKDSDHRTFAARFEREVLATRRGQNNGFGKLKKDCKKFGGRESIIVPLHPAKRGTQN